MDCSALYFSNEEENTDFAAVVLSSQWCTRENRCAFFFYDLL